jgi:DNA-binding SARP family transcriptional activator/tetratricopeptide (TPR) repeat protein
MVVKDRQAGQALRVQVLGPVRAWSGECELALGAPRQRAVLAMLAVHANHAVSRDELIDAVWGDRPPPRAAASVHVYINGLRRVLEPARGRREAGRVLAGAGSGYTLHLDPDGLDLAGFRGHLDRAKRLLQSDQAAAVQAFDTALALCQAAPLSGIPGPWAEEHRLQWDELRLAAVEDRAEAQLRLLPDAELIAELSTLTTQHPLRERPAALLMAALYLTGRQADALAVYVDTRRRLVAELGIEPGPALRQLHHDILAGRDLYPHRRTDQHSVPSGPIVPRQLPRPAPYFTGRNAELHTLTALLNNTAMTSRTVVVSAIDGTAGVGKTALAVHWAHQVADRFPDGHLYVNLRGYDPSGPPLTVVEAVRGFLDAFGLPPERIPAGTDSQIALYRSVLSGKQMLIMLDNARDADQVRPLLPGTPRALVLITSRSRLTPLIAAEGAHPLPLDLLTSDEARRLLANRLGEDRVAAEPGAVDAIIDRCSRLPLALAITAARAATHPNKTLTAIADDLRAAPVLLDALNAGDNTTDTRMAFSWSYRQLSQPGARLFRLLGLHCGPDITSPAAASLAGTDRGYVQRLLTELGRANLIIEHTPGRYTLHDLLRAYANELTHNLDTAAQRHNAVHRTLDHYLQTAYHAALILDPYRDRIAVKAAQRAPQNDLFDTREQAQAWFTAERPVLLAAIRMAVQQGFDNHTWQLTWALSDFLEWQGHWSDCVAIQRTALDAAHRLNDPIAQAHAHRGLARAYIRLGRYHESLTHLEHALHAFDDPSSQAHVHFCFSWALGFLDRSNEALEHARQAYRLFHLAGNLSGQARALNNIGWYHGLLGDHEQTLTHCEQALKLFRQVNDLRGLAVATDSIAHAHLHLSHLPTAIAGFQESARLHHQIADRRGEAEALIHLGDAHHAAAEHTTAQQAWQDAVTILDEIGAIDIDAEALRAKLRQRGTGVGGSVPLDRRTR